MKRVYKRLEEPDLLQQYREEHPQESWEHFRRRNTLGYRQIKRCILEDQHGLCAYCEIGIKQAETEDEVDDFRVEHFYPKSATIKGRHNYHLDWNNLLGVCHGGSQRDVPDAEWRFSTSKNDRSCDVPKGAKEITRSILNPLTIPGEVRLFAYVEHTGQMLVDKQTCPAKLQRKARNTIRELNLNAPRLMRMRKTVIAKLSEEVELELSMGANLESVLEDLAISLLLPNHEGHCMDFFTVIRWYLGAAAEKILATSGQKF